MKLARKMMLMGGGKKRNPNSVLLASNGSVNFGSDTGIDNLPASSEFTVEGWWYQNSAGGFITKYGWTFEYYSPSIYFHVWPSDHAIGGRKSTTYSVAALANTWVHLAAVVSGTTKTAKLYVNGTLRATSAEIVSTYDDSANNMTMQANTLFGWARISNIARYTSNFTPVSRLTPPDSDANTLALWKVSEGAGTTLDNAETTAARDGVIANGTWVYSP